MTPRHLHTTALLTIVASLATLVGCSDSEDAPGVTSSVQVERGEGDDTPYGEGHDVVVTDQGTYIVTGDADEGECVQIEDDCVDLSETRYCDEEGAQVDFIVVDGEVVDAICYPPPEDGTSIEEVVRGEDGTAQVPQNQSGAVVVFDEETDGEPIKGDVVVDAERTSIYGNGVDATILDGDLMVASNNSRVRGVTITGDVTYANNSNNSALAFCEVQGNLTVASNSATLLDCQVFGDVTVTGNDATLINIGVGGAWEPGSFEICDGCYSFTDEDEDFEVTDEERGDVLCGDDPGEDDMETSSEDMGEMEGSTSSSEG